MKVVLVNPFFTYSRKFIPQNLVELATYIKQRLKDVDIEIIDLHMQLDFSKSPDQLMNETMRIIKNTEPDLIGLSCHTVHVPFVYKFTNMFKKEKPEIPIVLGGSHVSNRYKEIFNICNIDFIVYGEGEETLLQLIKNLMYGYPTLDTIKGLVYKQDNKIISNKGRKLLPEIPFADYSLLSKYKEKIKQFPGNKLDITFSRGCIGNCIFCSTNTIWKGQRRKSIEKIENELNYLMNNFGLKYVEVSDNCFTLNNKWSIKVMQLLKNLNIDWGCLTRLDQANKAMLQIMADCNCKEIYFGVESGLEKYRNKALGKNYKDFVTNQYILNICKEILSLNVIPIFSFIYNMPHEGWDELNATFLLAKQLKNIGAKVQLWIMTPYHDSKVYKENQDLILKKSRYEIFKDASVFLSEQFGLFYDVIDLPEIIEENPDHLVLDSKVGMEKLRDFYLKSKVELGISNYEVIYDYIDYDSKQFVELQDRIPLKNVLKRKIDLIKTQQIIDLIKEFKKYKKVLIELSGDFKSNNVLNNYKLLIKRLIVSEINYKFINPIPIDHYLIPKNCEFCLDMFHIDKEGFIVFCNGKRLFRKDKALSRKAIYEMFCRLGCDNRICQYKNYNDSQKEKYILESNLVISKSGYSIPPWIEWVDRYGEVIIRNRLNEKVLYLNNSGKFIWHKIDDRTIYSSKDNEKVNNFLKILKSKSLIV